MDEIEARLAAVELALVELAAEIDPRALRATQEHIREGMCTTDCDENHVRRHAVTLMQISLDRH